MVAGESGLELRLQEKNDILSALAGWLKAKFSEMGVMGASEAVDNWQVLGGDAGFRHYFRIPNTILLSSCRYLAVWAPPESEKNQEFVSIAHHLKAQGLRAPEVYAFDPEQGFLLIEDLGESMLFDRLGAVGIDDHYSSAIELLVHLQQGEAPAEIFPYYSEVELERELQLFSQWFVGELLQHCLDEAEQGLLASTFELLRGSAAEQPQVIVHRDYHSRNIVICENNELGLIDFQDAVLGPCSYDVVSLLRDCYVKWPDRKVDAWAHDFYQLSKARGQLRGIDNTTFVRWFDWMGLQRHIKVLGIFSRLYLRDGKASYLSDLPLVIHYTRTVAHKYPQLSVFAEWFDGVLLPLAERQAWMKAV